MPFATDGGNPRKIIRGKVSREPPPANVFIAPENRPQRIKINISLILSTLLFAGILVDLAVIYIDKLKVDDPVGAIAVHGVNGLFGTIAVGLFASEEGLFFGGGASFLITQVIGVLAIATFSFIFTFIIMKIMEKLVGVRISREEEIAGIDSVSFGVESYSTYE